MNEDKIEYNGLTFDTRHGGPFNRGSTDSHYGRPMFPHYYRGKTYNSDRVVAEVGTPEHEAYIAGYNWNEEFGSKKEY